MIITTISVEHSMYTTLIVYLQVYRVTAVIPGCISYVQKNIKAVIPE